MSAKIKKLINEAIIKIIEHTSGQAKIARLQDKHNIKIHFIPKKYRIFGAIIKYKLYLQNRSYYPADSVLQRLEILVCF